MDFAKSNRLYTVALGIGIALLLAHMAYLHYFYPYIIADDTFISLRYAERFLEGKGLTWNDGEYVEGYSNLLWVLLNAGLGALGVPLPVAAQLLGIICTLLTLLALRWHARQTQLGGWPFMAGIVAFAIASPVAIWALAGMEAPMVMLLFAWVIVLCCPLLERASTAYAVTIGILLALICLLRPEGPVYTIAIAAGLMAFSALPLRQRVRLASVICLIPMACFLLQLAFRLEYYGQWFPNTVLAKVAFTSTRLASGFAYITNAVFYFGPLLFYAAINYWNIRHRKEQSASLRLALFLLSVLGMLCGAIVLSGGDFFPCFRAFMPLLPIVIILLMHGMAIGLATTGFKKEMIFFAYIFACHIWLQYDVDTTQLPQSSRWITDARAMGQALRQQYGATQPTIAVFAAGAIPYYSGLPALDVFGLNDPYLTAHRNEFKRFGNGVVGHELFNGPYIESKKPDILVFDIPGFHSICDAYPKECQALLPHYRPGVLHIPGKDVRIWLRNDSAKLGVK